jgi:hypothetical protein
MPDGLSVPGQKNLPALPPVIAGADTPEISRRVENFWRGKRGLITAKG